MSDDLEQLGQEAAGAPNLFRLDDKIALVVGGSSGLGQAMSLAMAAAGADLCIAGLGPTGLQETVDAIEALGRRGISYDVDATQEDQVEEMVQYVMDAYGRIDILVNSQGIVYLAPAIEFELEKWQQVIDVNLKSVFLCCKHVGRVMLEQGNGKIINMSSVRGFQARAEDMAYAPSKGGINQLTRSLAIEWGARGINVNGLAPTFIRTPLSASALDDPERRAWVLSRLPIGRVGERRDLFGPILFLASDASDMINGHILPVEGGWLVA
jgi:NAD(P)-dependent dehydrogenase (short-subunit alcohol dehydrogenase family)